MKVNLYSLVDSSVGVVSGAIGRSPLSNLSLASKVPSAFLNSIVNGPWSGSGSGSSGTVTKPLSPPISSKVSLALAQVLQEQ